MADLILVVVNILSWAIDIVVDPLIKLSEFCLTTRHVSFLNNRKFTVLKNASFDLYNIASAKLILNVLGSSKALENTSFY